MGIRFRKLLLGLLIFNLTTIWVSANTDEVVDEELPVEEQSDATDFSQLMIDDLDTPFEEKRPIIIADPNGLIDGHQLIAENEQLELYLKEETLSIIVRDKETSGVLYSTVHDVSPRNNQMWQNFMQSGVVLEYLTSTNVNATPVTLMEAQIEKNIILKETGFEAEVYFPLLGLGYTLSVRLTETGFTAEVLEESLIEEGEYLISGLYIYPFLGYAHLGNRDGYMLIPDGSGALIELQDHNGQFTQPFSKAVFGENIGVNEGNIPTVLNGHNVIRDAHNILMPVFGMVHRDSQVAFLGIIEGGGEFNSMIEAYPNGAITDYDWITAKFVYRQSFTQPLSLSTGSIQTIQSTRNSFDSRIHYEVVTGENAHYTGLALAYQSYLLNRGVLTPKDEAFRIRLDILGLEQEGGMIFNRDVVMTRVEDIESIYGRLQDAGVENILSAYRGWQRNGLSVGTLVRNFQVDTALGGNRGLTNLLKELDQTAIDFYLYQNPLRMNTSLDRSLRFLSVRQMTRQVFEEEVFLPVVNTFNFLQPSKVHEILTDLQQQYVSNRVGGVMLSGISNHLFSHVVRGTLMDRSQTASDFQAVANQYNEAFSLLLEQPFAYLWPYTGAYINTPVRGSNYTFVSEEVPFLAIVLKGILPMYSEYVNFEANSQEFFLNLVEQGIRPSFYLTMEDPLLLKHTNSRHIFTSQFDFFETDIVEFYHQLKDLHQLLHGATIENHQRIGELVKVDYSNGVRVYLNYSTTPILVEGMEIEPLSYKVGER